MFRKFLCPSSRVFLCTHSNGICLKGLLTACEQDQDIYIYIYLFILISFVCTSVRTTVTEWQLDKLIAVNNSNNNNNTKQNCFLRISLRDDWSCRLSGHTRFSLNTNNFCILGYTFMSSYLLRGHVHVSSLKRYPLIRIYKFSQTVR